MRHDHDNDAHDLGFAHDLPRLIGRRRVLGLMVGAGALAAAAPAAALDCVALPWETAGPFPGDGTNTRAGQVVNALTQAGVVREDIRSSFNGMSGRAEGIPLTLDIAVSDAASCGALGGHAIYLWHCDAAGRYSLYDLPEANYLRGVGVSDDSGRVRFRTILPGCYAGRWPHIHFEVFTSPEAAVTGEASVLTAQIALPEMVCAAAYEGDARYSGGAANLSWITLGSDNVFGDNTDAQIEQQMPSMQGDVARGFLASVAIPVDFGARRSALMPPRGGPGARPPRG